MKMNIGHRLQKEFQMYTRSFDFCSEVPVDETRQLRFDLVGSLRGRQEQIGIEVYAEPALADV